MAFGIYNDPQDAPYFDEESEKDRRAELDDPRLDDDREPILYDCYWNFTPNCAVAGCKTCANGDWNACTNVIPF